MMPAASVATSVTSASPIIRAAAVDAVRCGLRRALSRRSCRHLVGQDPGNSIGHSGPRGRAAQPHQSTSTAGRVEHAPEEAPRTASQPQRRAGEPVRQQPERPDETVTRRDPARRWPESASAGMNGAESSATPMKIRSVPRIMKSSTCVVSSPARRAPEEAAKPSTVRTRDRRPEAVRSGPGGSVAPSRTAAIGGTRVARIAGRRLAISVTRIPSAERDDDRARLEDEPAVRQREADGVEELEQALREQRGRGRGRRSTRRCRSRAPRR